MASNRKQEFSGVRWVDINSLGISQLYLNRKKLMEIEKWFSPNDMQKFQPLPVHDFDNGRLTLTDGHSRAFVVYKAGLTTIPVRYDFDDIVTSETGQILYKNDIVWCERFHLYSIRDLKSRIITDDQYQTLWIKRCEAAYHLLTRTTIEERARLAEQQKGLFLYGANEDLSILYFENGETGALYEMEREWF